MKKLQIILLQIFLTVSVFGQDSKHLEFDFEYFALKDSINPHLSFEETVKVIEEYGANDTQKLWLIAGWIYNNIDFDIDKFQSGGIINDYKTVFSLRKGTCGDYSNIFSAFCNRFNIPNEIIEGYVPELDSDKKIYYQTNHAWNVVKIGNTWYHCDLLGFSGYIEKDPNGELIFVKKTNSTNFLTQNLSYHIPADPMWQLSNYPVPMDALLKYRGNSKMDASGPFLDYEKEINRYTKLSPLEKRLTFAENAYKYNNNNSNVLVIEYYNASVELINQSNRNKQKLIQAGKYLEKAQKHITDVTDSILKISIEKGLLQIRKTNP